MQYTREELIRIAHELAEGARKVVARDTAKLAALEAEAKQQVLVSK